MASIRWQENVTESVASFARTWRRWRPAPAWPSPSPPPPTRRRTSRITDHRSQQKLRPLDLELSLATLRLYSIVEGQSFCKSFATIENFHDTDSKMWHTTCYRMTDKTRAFFQSQFCLLKQNLSGHLFAVCGTIVNCQNMSSCHSTIQGAHSLPNPWLG